MSQNDNKMNNLICDRYKLLSLIGKGGEGTVYFVMDSFKNKYVALKEFNEEYSNLISSDQISYIKSKIDKIFNSSTDLEYNSYFTKIYDLFIYKNRLYMAMEYVNGLHLSDIANASENLIIDIAIQICEALNWLYTNFEGTIYNDIKPNNIILADNKIIKIIDICSMFDFDNNNEILNRIASPHFSSEERFNVEKKIDKRSDIFSLGQTLYNVLTGDFTSLSKAMLDNQKVCYHHIPQKSFIENYYNVSEGLYKIIKKCTMVDAKDRYDDYESIICDLKNLKENVTEKNSNLEKLKTGFIEKYSKESTKVLNENYSIDDYDCLKNAIYISEAFKTN